VIANIGTLLHIAYDIHLNTCPDCIFFLYIVAELAWIVRPNTTPFHCANSAAFSFALFVSYSAEFAAILFVFGTIFTDIVVLVLLVAYTYNFRDDRPVVFGLCALTGISVILYVDIHPLVLNIGLGMSTILGLILLYILKVHRFVVMAACVTIGLSGVVYMFMPVSLHPFTWHRVILLLPPSILSFGPLVVGCRAHGSVYPEMAEDLLLVLYRLVLLFTFGTVMFLESPQVHGASEMGAGVLPLNETRV
jgi:hypothetical protein